MKMDFLRCVFFSLALLTWFASPATAALIFDDLNVVQSVTPVGATSSQFLIPVLPGATSSLVNQTIAALQGWLSC